MPLLFIAAVLSGCSASKEENIPEQNNSMLPLPPGTANISAEILSIEESIDFYSLEIMVLKVNRYGPSVPLIDKNSKMNIRGLKSLFEETGKPSVGNKSNMLVKNYPVAGNNKSFWEILNLDSQENK